MHMHLCAACSSGPQRHFGRADMALAAKQADGLPTSLRNCLYPWCALVVQVRQGNRNKVVRSKILQYAL